MVLPRFVQQAVLNETLTVYGDGLQSRCFCHVQDVVAALLGLLHHPDAEGDVFNVGSTEEISMLDLAQRVIETADSRSTTQLIRYEDAYEEGFEDMRRRVPDISKIGKAIGWHPERDLTQIIKELVALARNNT
jgi:UDP-glucose 4-epimerase